MIQRGGVGGTRRAIAARDQDDRDDDDRRCDRQRDERTR
jgi:hypothetical protein